MKALAQHLEEMGVTVEQLIASAKLDAKLVKAIVSGNYTPSPFERKRLAEALGISTSTVKRDWTTARAWLFRELNRSQAT